MISKHLNISGRVQGVGFRASLAREAARRGLGGWVRNRRDGSVEALVAGEAGRVDDLIAWARVGPLAARVARVEVRAGEDADLDAPDAPGSESAQFQQRPTA